MQQTCPVPFSFLVHLYMLAENNTDMQTVLAAASSWGTPQRPAGFSTWWAADMLAVTHMALSLADCNSHTV
jgi:hypothetical protein